MRLAKIVAGVAIAGMATFGGLSLTAPAMASGGDTTLVDVNVQNVLNGTEVNLLNDVSPSVAAVFCGINLNVLTQALKNNTITDCTAYSVPLLKKAYVKKAH